MRQSVSRTQRHPLRSVAVHIAAGNEPLSAGVRKTQRHPSVFSTSAHLVNLTPAEVIAPATWQSLAPYLRALPGPVVGFERPVNDPRPGEWGFPLPRWQRATALTIDHPHASHVAPLVRAWLDQPSLNALCDLQMHTWDIVDGRSATPCVFLRVDRRGDWKSMVRGYASALRNQGHVTADLTWNDVADRLEETAATTPVGNVSSIGIYLGRPHCPIRLTVRASLRPHSDHPAWAHVDEVVAAAKWNAHHVIVAFAPGADPGDTWHVPLLVDRRPRPSEALAPLLAALVDRGLATTNDAFVLASFDARCPLPLTVPTLDGVPATATLWVAPERIKVVVDPTGWRSAKVDFLARVIWRSMTGRVLVDH